MRLCCELHIKHPDYLDLTASQLQDWILFENQAGLLGPQRHDLHYGVIASQVINHMVGSDYKPSDFMPYLDDNQHEPTQEELANRMRFLFGKG